MIADVHAQAITSLPDRAELSLVVSTTEATARRLAEARGVSGHTTDFDAVLADPDIDALSISTPTGTHADLAVPALEASKHVMIEKPLDVSLEAADRIIAAERARERRSASSRSTASTAAPNGLWRRSETVTSDV